MLVVDGKGINESMWTVTGRIATPLPNWINNPMGQNHVDLTLSINVYVNPPDGTGKPTDPPYATLDDGVYVIKIADKRVPELPTTGPLDTWMQLVMLMLGELLLVFGCVLAFAHVLRKKRGNHSA
jgi:hypothetical protein